MDLSLSHALGNAVKPIMAEISDTLDSVDQESRRTIHAAVMNAALAGLRIGASEVAANVIEAGVDVTLNFDLPDHVTPEQIDEWLRDD